MRDVDYFSSASVILIPCILLNSCTNKGFSSIPPSLPPFRSLSLSLFSRSFERVQRRIKLIQDTPSLFPLILVSHSCVDFEVLAKGTDLTTY